MTHRHWMHNNGSLTIPLTQSSNYLEKKYVPFNKNNNYAKQQFGELDSRR